MDYTPTAGHKRSSAGVPDRADSAGQLQHAAKKQRASAPTAPDKQLQHIVTPSGVATVSDDISPDAHQQQHHQQQYQTADTQGYPSSSSKVTPAAAAANKAVAAAASKQRLKAAQSPAKDKSKQQAVQDLLGVTAVQPLASTAAGPATPAAAAAAAGGGGDASPSKAAVAGAAAARISGSTKAAGTAAPGVNVSQGTETGSEGTKVPARSPRTPRKVVPVQQEPSLQQQQQQQKVQQLQEHGTGSSTGTAVATGGRAGGVALSPRLPGPITPRVGVLRGAGGGVVKQVAAPADPKVAAKIAMAFDSEDDD